jgi:hypothetical protein
VVTDVALEGGITGNVVQHVSFQEVLEQPGQYVNQYNQHAQSIPSWLKTIMGDERINMEVAMDDGSTKKFAITTKKAKVESWKEKALEDPTLLAQTTEKVLNTILKEDDQFTAMAQAVKKKNITYKGLTFKSKAKSSMSKMVLSISSWFK